MYEIKIFDYEEENNKIIISLSRLVKVLFNNFPKLLVGNWEITKAECGYGLYACEIEDNVVKFGKYKVNGEKFFIFLQEEKEYFYDLEVKKINDSISLGVFDSTYLFIKSSDLEFIKTISKYFNNTEIENLN